MKNFFKSPMTALAILVMLTGFSGCGYPKVSQSTYAYAKAIYTVANQQDAKRIPAIRERIEQAIEEGVIQPNEARFLFEILTDADGGEWSKASRRARKLMMDQVETG